MITGEHNVTDIEFRTLPTDSLSDGERAVMFGLFDSCYRQANHAYLEDTIERLDFATIATPSTNKPAIFFIACLLFERTATIVGGRRWRV